MINMDEDNIEDGEVLTLKDMGNRFKDNKGIFSGKPLTIWLGYKTKSDHRISNLQVSIRFRDSLGRTIFSLDTAHSGGNFSQVPSKGVIICRQEEIVAFVA